MPLLLPIAKATILNPNATSIRYGDSITSYRCLYKSKGDNDMSSPTFAQIHQIELTELLRLSAPRCVFPVYIALCSYMLQKDTCYPSVKTIIAWCDNQISKSSVEKALRWLKENNILKIGSPKTRDRFTNVLRKGKTLFKRSHSISTPMLTQDKHKDNNKDKSPPYIPPQQEGGKKHRKSVSLNDRYQRAYRKLQSIRNVIENTLPTSKPSDPIQSLINDLLVSNKPPNPSEVSILQQHAENNEIWRYWCMAFNPQLWQQISGVRLRDTEVQYAMERWIDLDCKDIKINPFLNSQQ